jgi:nucleotide-binding universal stress UspA family protein
MYRKILLVTSDGTTDAGGALGPAIALADRFAAQLHMMVVEEVPHLAVIKGEVDDAKAAEDRRARFLIATARQRAEQAHVSFEPHFVVGHMVEHVIDFVHDNRIDLVVVPAAGTDAPSLLFGSKLERLI